MNLVMAKIVYCLIAIHIIEWGTVQSHCTFLFFLLFLSLKRINGFKIHVLFQKLHSSVNIVLYPHTSTNMFACIFYHMTTFTYSSLVQVKSFYIKNNNWIQMLTKLSLLIIISRHYWAPDQSSFINGWLLPFMNKWFRWSEGCKFFYILKLDHTTSHDMQYICWSI